MDCNNCKLEMTKLFDSEIDQTILSDLMEHVKCCPDCTADYQKSLEVLSMLKPKFQPVAPLALKQNIIQKIKMEETKMKNDSLNKLKFGYTTKKILSIAAILAVIMLIIPFIGDNKIFSNNTAKAANNLFESSIKATHSIKTMVINLKVRTIARDNFSLVGTEYEMVGHTIWKSFEEPAKWRVDKGERVVVFDGKDQYLWKPTFSEGIKAGADANFIEWLKILLDPEAILIKEQKAYKGNESKITMKEENGNLLMTIYSEAQGNFINDYCKNKSIEESDNRREYLFDSNTKLLKGLKIYILEGEKETLILEIEEIKYNVPVNSSLFSINLPKGVEWQTLTNNSSKTFKNISSKRAAELFFEGMANSDWKLVEEACHFFKNPSEKVIKTKEYFSGLTVISLGEPFKSGLYPGEFVPYEIKLKSGETKKHNLAVRNDNPEKVWVIDGGF